MKLREAIVAEFLGTALLVCVVVGSGIMGERLAGGNAAVALLGNSLATVAALFVLISACGPISGAHFNPLVTAIAVIDRKIPSSWLPGFLIAQFAGGLGGVALANLMFDLAPYAASTKVRGGFGQWLGEIVATLSLLLTIRLISRHAASSLAAAVACTIGAAYWFTSSTSFANPAVTIARAATDTFTGIRPADVPGFIAAQVIAAAIFAVISVAARGSKR